MSFLDRFRKQMKPVLATGSQPDNFFLAAQKYKDRPGALVRYKHKKRAGEMGLHVKDIPLSDTLEVAKTIEDFISNEWGGGQWQVEILNANNKVLATYNLGIAGTLYNVRTGKKASPDDPDLESEGGSRRRRSGAAYEEMMMRVTEAQLTKDPLEQMTQLGGVIAQLSGGSSKFEDLMSETFAVQLNNSIFKQENEITRFKELAELAQVFAPKIPTEDVTSSIIQAAPGILTALMMAKGGGAPPGAVAPVAALPPGGNGRLDMNALRNLAQSLPPEIISQFPADQQQAIMSLRNTAPSPGVALPRPGAPEAVKEPTASAGADPGVLPAPPGSPPASPAINQHHAAIDAMLEDIREGLRGDGTDKEAAQKILSMVAAARGFTATAPHPLLKGLMEAKDDTGEYEFRRFCAAIPELRADPERIDKIAAEIVGVQEDGAKETLESMEEAREAREAEAVPDFQYETQAESDQSTEESHDVSEPAGIQRQPGAEAEPDESVTDGEQAQQTDEPAAQAV